MIQHPGILKNNINHLSKRWPPPFFHSDTSLVLGNVLVHSVEKNPCSGCNRGINLAVVLEYTFLQLCSNDKQISSEKKFRKFRRSYTHTSLLSFKPTTMKCRLLFLLDGCCWKRPYSIFCCCLSVAIVHLRNLFLLSTLVVQMLLTPRWVNRREDVKYLFINIW